MKVFLSEAFLMLYQGMFKKKRAFSIEVSIEVLRVIVTALN